MLLIPTQASMMCLMTIVPASGRPRDPLHRMAAYAHASDALAASWPDVQALLRMRPGAAVADQLYRAIGSVGANLAEGYSRSSGADRARFFEYALGSARESIHWYRAAAPWLDPARVVEQVDRLTQVTHILLTVIPRERKRTIRPNASAVGP
jgi:four helix bundle protein